MTLLPHWRCAPRFLATYAHVWVLIAMLVAKERGHFPNFDQLAVTPYTSMPFMALGTIGLVVMAWQRRRVHRSKPNP